MPQTTHVFARFLEENNGQKRAVDINWNPVDGRIFGKSKKGVNLSVEQSLDYARQKEYVVSKWGPYKTDSQVYQNALKTQQSLTYYNVFNKHNGVNCLRTVQIPSGSFIRTKRERGFKAAQMIVDHYFRLGAIKK
jgi:hypothetical protein